MPLIHIADLHKRYGAVHALRGASCSLEPGAIGLLGPNGAGKTTLIKILLGLVRPTSGVARILDLDAMTQARQIRERVGYAPERDAYIPNLSGVAYLTLCAQLSGLPRAVARKRAHEVCDYVRIGEFRYREVQTYSTGMRQRIKIAQALAHDPKLVILDEPTNGLDPKGRAEVLRLCRELATDHGISLLFSSHLLHDVEQVCDQLLIVGAGTILRHGRMQDLQAPATWIDVTLRGTVPPMLEALSKRGWTHTARGPEQWRLEPAQPGDTGPVFEAAAAHGVEVRKLIPGRTTLQDVFEQAVGAA